MITILVTAHKFWLALILKLEMVIAIWLLNDVNNYQDIIIVFSDDKNGVY